MIFFGNTTNTMEEEEDEDGEGGIDDALLGELDDDILDDDLLDEEIDPLLKDPLEELATPLGDEEEKDDITKAFVDDEDDEDVDDYDSFDDHDEM
jgi:hypothetical protein